MRGNELLEILSIAHKHCINGKIIRKMVKLIQWLVIDYDDAIDILNNLPELSKEDALIILELYEQYKGCFNNYGEIIKRIRNSKNKLINNVVDKKNVEEIVFMLEIAKSFPIFKNDVYALEILLNDKYYIEDRKEIFSLIKHPSIYYKNDIVRIINEAYYYGGYEYAKILSMCLINRGIRKSSPCLHFLLNENDIKILKLARMAFLKNRIRKDVAALEELSQLKYAWEKQDFLNELIKRYPDDARVSDFSFIKNVLIDDEEDSLFEINKNKDLINNKDCEDKRKNSELTENLAILIDDYVRRDLSLVELLEELNNEDYQELDVRRAYVPRSLRKMYGYGRK